MPKLFVAVALPEAAITELVARQPPPAPGIRRAAPGQMHLTLHFIGEAEVEQTTAHLEAVAVPAFRLVIEGVGQFPSAGGAVTLWAGVRETAELLGLHNAVAAALAAGGFRPEARRYTPHITLARCGPETPAGRIDDFLARQAGFSLPDVPVVRFGLYSSAFVNDAPIYRLEQSFPLRAWEDGSSGSVEPS